MKKGTLTREQAIEIVGLEAVEKVEEEGCDYTNRVGFNGAVQGDEEVEFRAAVSAQDTEGHEVSLQAYYYQDADALVDCDDLGSLDWDVFGYEIE